MAYWLFGISKICQLCKIGSKLKFLIWLENHIQTTKFASVRSSLDTPIFKKIAARSSPAEMSTDKTGSDWIRTEANFGRIRSGSDFDLFENWQIRYGSG